MRFLSLEIRNEYRKICVFGFLFMLGFSYLYYLLSCLFIVFVKIVTTLFCCSSSSSAFATKSFICWPCIFIACIVLVMSTFFIFVILFSLLFRCFLFFVWLTTILRMKSESIKKPLFSFLPQHTTLM